VAGGDGKTEFAAGGIVHAVSVVTKVADHFGEDFGRIGGLGIFGGRAELVEFFLERGDDLLGSSLPSIGDEVCVELPGMGAVVLGGRGGTKQMREAMDEVQDGSVFKEEVLVDGPIGVFAVTDEGLAWSAVESSARSLGGHDRAEGFGGIHSRDAGLQQDFRTVVLMGIGMRNRFRGGLGFLFGVSRLGSPLLQVHDLICESFDVFFVQEGVGYVRMGVRRVVFGRKALEGSISGCGPGRSVDTPTGILLAELRPAGVYHHGHGLWCVRFARGYLAGLIELLDGMVLNGFEFAASAVGKLSDVLLEHAQFSQFEQVIGGLTEGVGVATGVDDLFE